MGKSEKDPKEEVQKKAQEGETVDNPDYFDGLYGKEEGEQDNKPEANPEDKKEDTTEKEAEEPKPEEEKEGDKEDVKGGSVIEGIPSQFIVKNEDGSIDWKETSKKIGKSYDHANRLIGKKGQELGDTKKTVEELQSELAKEREEWRKKYEANPNVKNDEDNKEELTSDQLYELIEKNPQALIEKVQEGVLNKITMQRMQAIEKQKEDGQLFAKEVNLYFAAHPDAKEKEPEIYKMFMELPDREKDEAMRHPHATMNNLWLQLQLQEKKELLEKAQYKPEAPKEEKGGISVGGKVDKYDGLDENQRYWAEAFGLEKEDLKNLNKGK